MARSKRKDKLRCFHCEKRDGLHRPNGLSWRNVEVYGETKRKSAKVRCRTCGHTYISMSAAAYRALEQWRKTQPDQP